MKEISVEDHLVNRVEEIFGIALKGDIKGRRFLDRILIMPWGRTYYVEVKRPKGGRYSGHQLETMARLRAAGHDVLTIHRKDQVDAAITVWTDLYGADIERMRAWHQRPRSRADD
jgi:hypothetical protein